jgi:excisionase family DNA binding protein
MTCAQELCSKELSSEVRRGRPRKYCSDECKRLAEKERAQEACERAEPNAHPAVSEESSLVAAPAPDVAAPRPLREKKSSRPAKRPTMEEALAAIATGWLTVLEYAVIMRVATKTVYTEIEAGHIPVKRMGRHLRIPASEVRPPPS